MKNESKQMIDAVISDLWRVESKLAGIGELIKSCTEGEPSNFPRCASGVGMLLLDLADKLEIQREKLEVASQDERETSAEKGDGGSDERD